MASANEISKWYEGKTIFITGASGFMGKVLIEKLLYSCPGLSKIYILMRPKRGKSVNVRLDDMAKLPLFERLLKAYPDALKKLMPIEGDVLSDNLGLDHNTIKKLHEEVNLVFHMAATLKLEANLKDSLDMNTTGTWRVIEISRLMKNLNLFVHVSTAFCYPDLKSLGEKVVDWPQDPHDVMKCAEWMDVEAIQAVTPMLLKDHSNTYTYSKRLAEILVKNEYPKMPMVIARPSIVSPAWEEPIQGWVDNLNGPVGVMVAAGKGVIRTMHCVGTNKTEIISVDYAINALIILAYKNSITEIKPAEIPVYNLSTGDRKNTTWSDVLNMGKAIAREYPFEMPLWYPDGDMHDNKWTYEIYAFFLHLIPAYFIDFLMLILGQKRFMVRIYKRVALGLELLQFFTTRAWKFDVTSFNNLRNNLTTEAKNVFPTDLSVIEEKEYMKRTILGGRQYCMKEPLSSIPRCRRIHNVLWVVDRSIKLVFFVFLCYLLIKYSETAKSLAMTVPILQPYVKAI